jgi:cytochrome c oxidase assembly protein Cox11
MMPVQFVVNAALPPEVGTISIAYTLFNSVDRERPPDSS